MIHLQALLQELHEKNEDALTNYFHAVSEQQFFDLIFYILMPKSFKLISRNKLNAWALEKSTIPQWLYEKCLSQTKNVNETLSLLLPTVKKKKDNNFSSILNQLLNLKNEPDSVVHSYIQDFWGNAPHTQRMLFNRIISGRGFTELSAPMFYSFLSARYQWSHAMVALKFSDVSSVRFPEFKDYLFRQTEKQKEVLPQFFPLPQIVGKAEIEKYNLSEWNIHAAYSQLEVQLIKKENELFVWGPDSLFLSPLLPESNSWMDSIPNNSHVFASLQIVEEGVLFSKEKIVSLLLTKGIKKGHDLKLEIDYIVQWNGLTNLSIDDIEITSSTEEFPIRFKTSLKLHRLDELMGAYEVANSEGANGLLFKNKRLNQTVHWPRPKTSFIAALSYAQKGVGALSNEFIQYTFAVLHNKEWMSVAKLDTTDISAEIKMELSQWIGDNRVERFGPVLSVPPLRFFELSAEQISVSSRHKSGIKITGVRLVREIPEADGTSATTLAFLLFQLPKS